MSTEGRIERRTRAWRVLDFEGANLKIPARLITVSVGAKMVNNLAYYSFNGFDLREPVPFVAMLPVRSDPFRR